MPAVITKTIKPAGGGDFTTVTAFFAAIPSSLVAVDEQWIGECVGSGTTEEIDLGSHTTDATRNIILRAAAGSRHNGTPGTGFKIYSNTWAKTTLKIHGTKYVELDGLEIEQTSGSGSSIALNYGKDGTVIRKCILSRGTKTNGIPAVTAAHSNTTPAKLINCLGIGGNIVFSAFHRSEYYGCVAIKSGTGFKSLSGSYAKKYIDCIGFGNTTIDFDSSVNTFIREQCASSDASASGIGAVTNIASNNFTDAANNDFHLVAGSALIDAGGNYSTIYTDDIVGTVRGALYDIGAFEFVGGGGGGVSGDLSALELNDSFNASGAADTAGNLATSELSTDLLNSTGFIANAGSLSVSETGTDSFLADANVIISGDVVVNEPATDTALITGSNSVLGSLSITENSTDLLSSVGQLLIDGSFGATELNSDSFLITGNILIEGGFSTTEQSTDSLLSNGSAATLGTLNVSESNNDSLSATGTVITNGNVDVVENSSDVFVSSGENKIQGFFLSTEAGLDLFQINGVIATGGQVNITETETDLFAAGIIQLQEVDFKNAIFVNSVNTTFYNR